MDKKVVFWKNQNFTEAFVWSEGFGGWKQVDASEKQNWKPGTFEFNEMIATDDQFANRINGCVRW